MVGERTGLSYLTEDGSRTFVYSPFGFRTANHPSRCLRNDCDRHIRPKTHKKAHGERMRNRKERGERHVVFVGRTGLAFLRTSFIAFVKGQPSQHVTSGKASVIRHLGSKLPDQTFRLSIALFLPSATIESCLPYAIRFQPSPHQVL